ncbi:MAG: alpha/beta hydrolase [Rubrivivax sp.]|nr:alpha/beta hydrolase [Rubrivivax sp.]
MNTGAAVERHFARCAGLRLHWRSCGAAEAPPLVLLHPSPRHSGLYEPWMPMLAAHFRVLALDTPGYGQSDALPQPPASVADYLPVLQAWAEAVAGAQPLTLYGSATGAQLAIAWANSQPQRIRRLFLDNAAHFDDAECEALLARYFVDLPPQADGSHLQQAWQMAAQQLQFFPWFAADEAHRVGPPDPPPAAVQATLMDLLSTGPQWATAYRAAFQHERARHVQALQVPTLIFRWEASILGRHIDALLAHPLPAHVRSCRIPGPMAERLVAMTQALRESLEPLAPRQAAAPSAP